MPDGDGGWFIHRPPRFTPADIDMFEAARLVEESISPRGIRWEDEWNPKSRFRTGDEKGLPQKNFALIAQAKAEKKYEAAYGTKDHPVDMTGVYFPVTLVE